MIKLFNFLPQKSLKGSLPPAVLFFSPGRSLLHTALPLQPPKRRFKNHRIKLDYREEIPKISTSNVNNPFSVMGKLEVGVTKTVPSPSGMAAPQSPQWEQGCFLMASPISPVIYCHSMKWTKEGWKNPSLQLGWVFSELAQLSSRYKRRPQLKLGRQKGDLQPPMNYTPAPGPQEQQISLHFEG